MNDTTISQDAKNIALLSWIGTIFLGFIPGLVLYLVKKDDAFVQEHAKEALNWSITAIFGYIAASILMFVLVGFLVMAAVGICHLIFCIMGAVAASNGAAYKAPFAVRLVK